MVANTLRGDLKRAIEAAGGNNSLVPLNFFNAARSGGATLAQAQELYREAKYWMSQGAILSQYPSNVPLDPRLAREVKGSNVYAGGMNQYETNVRITLTDPNTGRQIERYRWISSIGPPSLDDLREAVTDEIGDLVQDTPLGGAGPDPTGWVADIEVTDFGRVT